MTDIEGTPRSYFYGRLLEGMKDLERQKYLIENRPIRFGIDMQGMVAAGEKMREKIQELLPQSFAIDLEQTWKEYSVTQETAVKVNIQEQLSSLKFCPCCGEEMGTDPTYPQERSCECGDFTVQSVFGDGDVIFEFRKVAQK